jgi:pimeloyl-ACP methyl ester carboxylesterase
VSPIPSVGRQAGLLGLAVGVVAAGAAIGFAAERYAVGRSFRGGGRGEAEPIGRLTGDELVVMANDRVPLHAEIDVVGDGPLTVVFCHGYALNLDCWYFQRRDLRADPGLAGRLVFWDVRGHGRSGRGDVSEATIEQLGKDLQRVLEATAPSQPVVLVGHSMGGMTVMGLAQQDPGLFGGQVMGAALLSTSPGRLADVTLGAPAAVGRALRRVAPGVLRALRGREQLVDHGRRMGSDISYVLTKRYAFASDVPTSLVEYVEQMISSTPFEVLAELYPAFDSHDKLAALDAFAGVETLIMVGAQDLLTPADHSRDMVERVPNAELVVVPDAGHLVQLEYPEVVTEQLRGLFARASRIPGAA